MRSLSLRDQLRRQALHLHAGRSLGNVVLQQEVAGQDPHYIAVYRRLGPVKGNAENSPGRIGANSLKPEYRIAVIRDLSAVQLLDLPRRMLQIPGTRIIAQSLPAFKHFFFRRIRQRLHRRETLDKPVEIRNDCVYSRLLQHNFRYPDIIRIAVAPPWQVPFLPMIPFQQIRAEKQLYILLLLLLLFMRCHHFSPCFCILCVIAEPNSLSAAFPISFEL
ncbi:hypothetical protein D3C75_864170 [compost metagenome]